MILLKMILIILGLSLDVCFILEVANCIVNGWKYGSGKTRQIILYYSLIGIGIALIVGSMLLI